MSAEDDPTNIEQRGKNIAGLRHISVELTQEQRIKKYRRRFMYQLARRSQYVAHNPMHC